MDKLKIYTYSTLIIAIALAFYLVSSIKYSIDEEARIDKAESLIIDNLKIISEENLQNSLKVFMEIIESFELGIYPKYKFECEPQLGKRGLYPNTSRIGVYTNIKDRMNFLAYSDGKNNLFEIARKLDKPLNILLEEYRLLKKHNLIKSEHV